MSDYIELILSDDGGLVFHVDSSSSDFTHTVSYDYNDGWWCTCEQYTYRRCFCKHMQKAKKHAELEGFVTGDEVFMGLERSEVL